MNKYKSIKEPPDLILFAIYLLDKNNVLRLV